MKIEQRMQQRTQNYVKRYEIAANLPRATESNENHASASKTSHTHIKIIKQQAITHELQQNLMISNKRSILCPEHICPKQFNFYQPKTQVL